MSTNGISMKTISRSDVACGQTSQRQARAASAPKTWPTSTWRMIQAGLSQVENSVAITAVPSRRYGPAAQPVATQMAPSSSIRPVARIVACRAPIQSRCRTTGWSMRGILVSPSLTPRRSRSAVSMRRMISRRAG